MKSFSLSLLLLAAAGLGAPAVAAEKAAEKAAPAGSALISGVDVKSFDPAVRPQDDFYAYVNGRWASSTQIPASKARWGTYDALRETAALQVRAILDEVLKNPGAPGSETRKIADLYTSFIDEAARNARGFAPLKADFERIAAVTRHQDLAALMAELTRQGVNVPFNLYVGQDAKNAERNVVYAGQSGLGLPDRDYYLNDADKKLSAVRQAYQQHITRLFTMQGDAQAERHAANVLALETRLAQLQWNRVESRDALKTYNPRSVAQLAEEAPGLDWGAYLHSAGIAGKASSLVVRQPSYFTGLAKLVAEVPLEQWHSYFKWHVLEAYSPYLAREVADERFAFTGTVLRGVPENEPMWRQAQQFVDAIMGEAVGKLYVAKHFPPENKARMLAMVNNFLATFREGIEALEWMSPATKKEAQAKLALFTPKIGYPDVWRDYSALSTSSSDLVANVRAGHRHAFERAIAKLGKPVDRGEWGFTPQTVNASYSPLQNAITFPAALLQPPFFDVRAEDAINYGTVGTSIGHEISHGFDDQGSRYDGHGNLRNWWTDEDRAAFTARANGLVQQYSAFSPVPGYHVNGQFTLGENIGDNSGVTIAYKAYRKSLGGKPSPVIDGLTGEQRLYIGWAVKFRTLQREDAAIVQLKSDPHSPGEFRVKGTLANQAGFYEAFDIKPGDKMYRAPEQRVKLW
ncbi:M13 family metallopeptidase [Paucibacter sp. APW11]|uniref:M13 family metallopeptidase n=1 Tax=Roseateles aquae TaxID=3077235 RepID=A0ABU3PE71_9BURK|nr:M13 family metallopeptidase [Paucibacter sp. APW11]MDT9000635.1 M13 family metallopeptidase [Paucibacter sp. APW11]